jgi:hypothetical protein
VASYSLFNINSLQKDSHEVFIGVDVAIDDLDYVKRVVDFSVAKKFR